MAAIGLAGFVLADRRSGETVWTPSPSGATGRGTGPAAVESESPSSSSPVARLNDSVITRSDVLIRKAMMDTLSGEAQVTYQQAFDALVRDRLLYAEARRRGMAMSIVEAAALARSHQKMYADRTLPDYEQVQGIINSIGTDEHTYWTSIAPRYYAMMMSIAALRGSLGSSEAEGDLPAMSEAILEEARMLEQVLRVISARARLEILDRKFLQGPPNQSP